MNYNVHVCVCVFVRLHQADFRPKAYGLLQGMVVLSEDSRQPPICRAFEAKLYILYHEGAVRIGFEATVHVRGVMQTATVVSMGDSEVT